MSWFSKGVDGEALRKERQRIIDQMPLEGEKCDCFSKCTEEIRAEPELGGLGPGLTGEHTLYSFVVARNDKRWVLKKRFRQLFTFDQMLLSILREQGKDESELPEFPDKKLFGKMSPSLVKEREAKLEKYLKAITNDEDLVREPLVREFLGLPMTEEEAQQLEACATKSSDGLLSGFGEHESLFSRSRKEKRLGIHHSQRREKVAGPPTLGGAADVGAAFAESGVDDPKSDKKFVIRVPFLGQTVKEIFGGDVRGIHSTYGEKVRDQVRKNATDADGKPTKSSGNGT